MRKFNFDKITLYLEPLLLLIPLWGVLVVMGLCFWKYYKLHKSNTVHWIRLMLSVAVPVSIGAVIGALLIIIIPQYWPDFGYLENIVIFFLGLSVYIWELIFYRKYKRQINEDNKTNN